MSALPSSKRLFTVDEVHAMHRQGYFAEGERVELVQGEIFVTPPPGERHNASLDRLFRVLVRSRHGYPAGGIGLRFDERNEVEPDLVFRPLADDAADVMTGRGETLRRIALIAEVAYTSHQPDLSEKVETYSAGGIPEYLVVDVLRRQVFHFVRDEAGQLVCPSPFRNDEVVTLRAAPDVPFRVSELL